MKLSKILLKKENIHWTRMFELKKEMIGAGGIVITYPIIIFILTISHYAFAGMHTAFEIYLFLFNQKQFELNMINIEKHLKEIET
jgi:hypothetical protein